MDLAAFHLAGVGAVQALSLLLLEHKFLVMAIRRANRAGTADRGAIRRDRRGAIRRDIRGANRGAIRRGTRGANRGAIRRGTRGARSSAVLPGACS